MSDANDLLAMTKAAICLRQEVRQIALDKGWSKEGLADLEGGCERIARRLLNEA